MTTWAGPPHGFTIYQVSAQSDVNCRKKSKRTDGLTPGYNIIRPFFKQAYNNDLLRQVPIPHNKIFLADKGMRLSKNKNITEFHSKMI